MSDKDLMEIIDNLRIRIDISGVIIAGLIIWMALK